MGCLCGSYLFILIYSSCFSTAATSHLFCVAWGNSHHKANLLSSLLVLGADPAALDGDGCTPELVAKRAGQTLCEQVLQVVVAEEQKESWYVLVQFLEMLIKFACTWANFLQIIQN